MISEPSSQYDRHIWHFCKTGEHEKCAGFGSLVQRKGKPRRTWIIDRSKDQGLETAYCECPCHARRETGP